VAFTASGRIDSRRWNLALFLISSLLLSIWANFKFFTAGEAISYSLYCLVYERDSGLAGVALTGFGLDIVSTTGVTSTLSSSFATFS